jgi:hypothetical protein
MEVKTWQIGYPRTSLYWMSQWLKHFSKSGALFSLGEANLNGNIKFVAFKLFLFVTELLHVFLWLSLQKKTVLMAAKSQFLGQVTTIIDLSMYNIIKSYCDSLCHKTNTYFWCSCMRNMYFEYLYFVNIYPYSSVAISIISVLCVK